ncbi:DUF4382 domain-containing protein [Formosa sp. Hel1_31_208]|uniref:DUF4382 domain-containing protein n=1 Tax=Formosa sp. Hel1_31_208 TaxID=1798225 RepID=UPI001E4BD2F8|nr:DUF4382 domain-containing protein [Formosa sp. Hel1_31_208]
MKLSDAPGDYEFVYVDVVDILVKLNNDDDSENGWQSLEAINTGIYNLLELTGGVNVLLADNYQIPSGTLNQIRLVLGDNNTIVIDGEEFPLSTPSAQQSGLKIQVNEELLPNFEYTFLLDFNVDESIVNAGNSSNIILKPVIRAIPEITSGTISGTITPSSVLTEIIINIDDQEVSTFTDANGNFLLVGLPEGIFNLSINPDPSSDLNDLIIEDIQVLIGENTDIGIIELM